MYLDRTCMYILMCVVPQAGLQIDVENLHSKLPSLTTTYHKISTLLDGLGESSNFFALWTLCISERKKIEAAVFLFSVLPKFQFHVDCLSGNAVYMAWQGPKRSKIIENLLARFDFRVPSVEPRQFFTSLLKNDQFSLHQQKNHFFTAQQKLIACLKMEFNHLNHS